MDWKLIVDTYHALPASDRTSGNVHARLLEQGHSVSPAHVETVLSATVLGEVLTEEDVRATVKTLNTLVDIRPTGYATSEPGTNEIRFASALVGTLTSIVGPSAVDLTEALARVVREHRKAEDIERQLNYLNYIDRMNDLRRYPDDGEPL